MLEIESNRVGFIRSNTKYSYPSDNSVIRVEKNEIGNKRLGNSVIIKDNLLFGVRESEEAYKNKAGEEEEFLNRDAWATTDRRCEFWVKFENGVKLLVEMDNPSKAKFEEKLPLLEPLPTHDLLLFNSHIEQLEQEEAAAQAVNEVPPVVV